MRSDSERSVGTLAVRFKVLLRSAFKALPGAVLCLALTVGPVAAFARLLQAEGPLTILFGWTALSAILLRAALRLTHRWAAAAVVKTLAAIVVLAGIGIVLLQVNVARRSLAEAWLDLARKGEAFGFFSFFASEVYALFALGQTAFLSARKPLAWLVSAAASNALCFGIIFGNGFSLAIAAALTLVLALTLNEGPIRARLTSLSVPFAAAALISLLYASWRNSEGERFQLPSAPDMTAIFALLAPGFPLLVDVPGYGFSTGSGEMPSTVFLTTRPLWFVQGSPYTTHYLANERYAQWNGAAWALDPDPGSPVAVLEGSSASDPGSLPESFATALYLTLTEDFFPSVPIKLDTVALVFPDGIPPGATANRGTGARFTPSIRRGQRVTLLSQVQTDADPQNPAASPLYLDTASNTPRMKSLAAKLVAQARTDAASANLYRSAPTANTDSLPSGAHAAPAEPPGPDESRLIRRRFVALLLSHFASGYEYSLDAGKPPAGAEINDWFVFEQKRGFCVYYASAFVMLAREAGIPSRMAQGWRVTLGERGAGVITGSNAHAWPELLLDGDWRTFEPTPPYAQDDPFAYTRSSDRTTRRQLENLYGSAGTGEDAEGFKLTDRTPLFTSAALALAAAVYLGLNFLRFLLEGERGRIIRKARKAVKKAGRKGVPTPETTGWLAWKAALPAVLPEHRAVEAAALADQMIAITYAEAAPQNRPTRKA